jgi:hypothetical protein
MTGVSTVVALTQARVLRVGCLVILIAAKPSGAARLVRIRVSGKPWVGVIVSPRKIGHKP